MLRYFRSMSSSLGRNRSHSKPIVRHRKLRLEALQDRIQLSVSALGGVEPPLVGDLVTQQSSDHVGSPLADSALQASASDGAAPIRLDIHESRSLLSATAADGGVAPAQTPTVPTNAPITPAANSSITLSDDVPPTEVSLRESDAEAAALDATNEWAAKREEIEEPDMMTMSCCCGGGGCDPTASVSSNTVGFVERSGTSCGTGTDRYFTFTLTGDFSGCRDVHFSVASSTDPGETLVEPDDFSFYSDSTLTSLGGGEYTIEVGPASGDEIRVYVASDNDAEPETDEDIQVSILPGQGYQTGTTGTDASMTIYDDDAWMIKVERTSPAATIVERDGAAQFAIFRVDDGSGRSGDTTYGILVDLAMSGAATQYTDYNLNDAGGYLGLYGDKTVIAEGETSIGVTLTTINDHLKENDKLAELSFQSATSFDPAGGTFAADPANDSASVTILDDDWWDATVSESDDEALEPCTWIPVNDRRGAFVVTRVPADPARADTTASAKVELEFSGTATPLGDFYGDDPRDYEILDASGAVIGAYEETGGGARATVTIAPGETSAVAYVQPHGDHIFEEIETVVATVAEAYCGVSDGSDPDYLYGIGSPGTSGPVNIIQAPEFVSEVDGPFTGPRPINADSYHRIISAVAKTGTDTYGDMPIDAVAPGGRTFNYSIHAGNGEGLFQIDATTGEITAAIDFADPQQTEYSLQIKAFDTAEPRLYDLATVSIVLLDLNTLTLTDGNDATYSVTDPTGTETLYVLQQEDGTAPIDIGLTWTPDAVNYAGYMKWKLDGADLENWSPTSGGFSGGSATTTWTDPENGDPNREFTTIAWADMNGDGDVDPDEPTRELELVVAKATFTIFADQPVAGDPSVVYDWDNEDPGHAFWSVTLVPADTDEMLPVPVQDEVNERWGFYPQAGHMKPSKGDISAPGEVRNNGTHEWDVRLSVPITERPTLLNILEYTDDLRDAPGTYNIATRNCTDIAIIAAGVVGLTLPDCEGDVYDEEGDHLLTCSCPAVLGEELADLGGERHP